ncbi:unnamed protein product [Durusdinium trenchii]|uniref:Tyrosine-protein kinase ephrin type A/B receptor-like domain-containing protein n=1 Tax=Durusdinium trenchii TaxID=1381693 RepID=A0ABP0RN53_9DINO
MPELRNRLHLPKLAQRCLETLGILFEVLVVRAPSLGPSLDAKNTGNYIGAAGAAVPKVARPALPKAKAMELVELGTSTELDLISPFSTLKSWTENSGSAADVWSVALDGPLGKTHGVRLGVVGVAFAWEGPNPKQARRVVRHMGGAGQGACGFEWEALMLTMTRWGGLVRAWEAVNGYRYFFKDATKYTLGNATNATELVVWQPFPENDRDSAVGANIRAALFNLYHEQLDKFKGHIDAYVWSSGFDESMTVGDCRKQWWPIPYSKWSPQCKPGRAQMLMGNLSECKQAMLEYEMDTLIFERGICELLTCPTKEATVSLLPGTAWAVKASKRQVFSTWCTEVLYANMPQNHTFLGGSGLIIPKKAGDRHNCHRLDVTEDKICLREKEGWKIILELSDTDKPFMKQANLLKQQSVPPPRLSLAEAIQARSKLWYPVVTAMKNGIPSQYPNTPIPESADIEEMKPVRLAMLETIYGNVSEETSLGHACEILDDLVRPCNAPRWETDVRCLNPFDGLAGCEAGSHLDSDQLGIIRCRPCESGTYRPDRSVDQTCEPCPVGRYAAKRGSGNCSVCPLGLVAQSPGQVACFNCSAGQTPECSARCRECPKGTYQEGFQCVDCPLGYTSPMKSPNETYCFPKASLIWLNFLLVLDVCALLLLLPSFFGKPVAVQDIYLDEGKLVLKTWGSHQVHRWAPLPVKIRLTHTHHYLLEEKNVFRVKWRDPDELYLLQDQGEHISKDINTSWGRMRIFPRCSLWASATCGIPSLIVLVFLLVILALYLYWAILNGIGEAKHLPWSLSIALLGALGVLVVHYWVWRNHVLSTPLRRRQGSFKQRLLKANPNPQPTERGPDRAITAEQIGELFEYFRDFIRRRDMHYVTNNLVLPFTKPYHLSYAEVAGPSRASWFVSHCWSNAFEDFFHSLQNMAQGKACFDWRKVTFWICSFSNNQFKVQEELGDGDPLKSSFYLALQSPECHGTAMVLDNDCVPLQRSWCLFELLQTRYVAPKLKSGYEGLLLCTPNGVLQWGNAHVDTVVRLAEKVGEIRLENAEASRVEDKIMIDACVIETVPGGFAEVNKFAKECIKTVLDAANGSFQVRVQELMQRLDREGSPVAPLAPRLLGRNTFRSQQHYSGSCVRQQSTLRVVDLSDPGCPT